MGFIHDLVNSGLTSSQVVSSVKLGSTFLPISGSQSISVAAISGAGVAISVVPDSPVIPETFFAVITDKGPNDEADYTDERYWVKRSYVDGKISGTTHATGETDYITTSFDRITGSDGKDLRPFIVTASNMSEQMLDVDESGISARQAGSHLLPKGTRIIVHSVYDRQETVPQKRFYFDRAPSRFCLVQVTGDASGGGKYTGKIMKPISSTPTATGDLTDDELGDFPSADNCYVFNAAEEGQSTHDLTSGSPNADIFPGMILPRRTGDNKLVVVINGYDFEACTP